LQYRLPEVGSFFIDELELWGNDAHNSYVYFLMSMKSALKLLDAYIYFLMSMKSALKLLD